MPEKQTPYQRIVQAALKGRGVRLTWEECREMLADTAISERARMDDEGEE